MNSEESIFAEALRQPTPQARAAFLDQACAAHPELRREIDALLTAHDRAAADFLETPPTVVVRTPSGDAAASPPQQERAGATVGPYKLLQQLGEGGMGVVFMAEQLRPVRRMVALKIIKPGLDTKSVIARFEAERQALAMMDHPNIAKVFDAGTTDTGRPYFAMELVRGVPITDYCDQHQLTPRQRLELFVQVCQAVQHAHTKGIIHRDLKPNNVLITHGDGDRPTPKIIDFGIAKATAGQRLTELTLVTEFRQLIGTPLYMSPEQAEMSAVQDVDTRSDVYSLGVLLYELLTGTTPFDKHRMAKAAYDEVRRIIREEEPPRPSTRLSTLGQTLTSISAQRQSDPKKLSQTVRGELDWIVMRAMEKERSRRYETANAMARDVERYLADEPVEACPPSRVYRLRKMIRRNKAALATAAVIAVVLVAATTISSWEAVRAHRAERQVTHERDQAQAEKNRADQQAATAGAIKDFMVQDVLSQAIPGVQFLERDVNSGARLPDPDITVREAVQRAADHLEEKFKEQPLVEASVRMTIGMVHGPYDKQSIIQLERALQLFRQYAPNDDIETLYAMSVLADVYKEQGRTSDAFSLLKEAVARARKYLGDGNDDTIALSCDLVLLYCHAKQFDAAEALLQKLMDDDRNSGGSHRDLLNSTLGDVYLSERKYGQAEPLELDAYRWHVEHAGPHDPATLVLMRQVGRVYAGEGKYWMAEAMLVQAMCQLHLIHADAPAVSTEGELRDVFKEHAKHPEAGPMFLGGPQGVVELRAWIASWQQRLARPASKSDQTQAHDADRTRRLRNELADFLHPLQIDPPPNDGPGLAQLAAIQLYLGDDEGYARTARQIQARFPTEASFAKLQLIAPIGDDAKRQVRPPAPSTSPASPGLHPYGELYEGMADYRAGDFAKAADLLALSARHFDSWNYSPTPANLAIAADAYRAMAEYHVGHWQEARAALAGARQRLKKWDELGSKDSVGTVPWCIGRIALRQAEAVLAARSPTTAPSTARAELTTLPISAPAR